MMVRVGTLVLAVILPLASCAPAEERGAEPSETGAIPEDEGSASQTPRRPRPGAYVYDLLGVGATSARVPQGSQLTETVSASGDVYTVDVTNNQNDNTQRIRLQWKDDRVLQLSNERVVGGRTTSCPFDPPLELIRIPIRHEEYREQSSGCDETTQVSVTGRQQIDDATGKTWDTWVFEVSSASGGRTDQATRWFSPDLGRDVRIDTISETPNGRNETTQLLRSYPSG